MGMKRNGDHVKWKMKRNGVHVKWKMKPNGDHVECGFGTWDKKPEADVNSKKLTPDGRPKLWSWFH